MKPTRGKREHWETSVCQLDSLNLVEIRDNGAILTIVVESANYQQVGRFQFVWTRYCAYRSIDEAHWIPWDLDPSDVIWHNTHRVKDSQWIVELAEGNGLLELDYPNLQHFVIATSDSWTEILSNRDPEISSLK